MMYLIFKNSDKSFYLATTVINSNFETEEFVINQHSNYKHDYSYSFNSSASLEGEKFAEAIEGDQIPLDQNLIDAMNAEVVATQYQNDRRNEYPDIKEQLDKLYHDIRNGTLDNTGNFFTSIKAVKDAHPKPE